MSLTSFYNILRQLHQMSLPSSVYVQHRGSDYLNHKTVANEEGMFRAAEIARVGQEALNFLEQWTVGAGQLARNYDELAKELEKCKYRVVWKDLKEMSGAERKLWDQISDQIRSAARLSDVASDLAKRSIAEEATKIAAPMSDEKKVQLAKILVDRQENSKEGAKNARNQLAFVCHAVMDSKRIGERFYDGGIHWTHVNVWMLEHLRAYRDQLTDPAKQQQIDRLIHDYEKQEKYANIIQHANIINSINNLGLPVDEFQELTVKEWLVKEIWVDIQKLQPGERVVVQGGYAQYRTDEAGHAVEYVIERQTNGKLSFTIINTGEGVVLVWDRIGFKYKVYDCVWKDIEPDQMNEAFLEQLFEPRFFSGSRTDMATIISSVDVALQKKADRGRLHNIQQQRSCVLKSLVSSIHERLPPATFWEFKAFYTERELAGLDTKLEASDLSKTLSPKEFAQAKDQFKAEAQEVLKKRQKKSRQANQPPANQSPDEIIWLYS
jgi:hypothetical protein